MTLVAATFPTPAEKLGQSRQFTAELNGSRTSAGPLAGRDDAYLLQLLSAEPAA